MVTIDEGDKLHKKAFYGFASLPLNSNQIFENVREENLSWKRAVITTSNTLDSPLEVSKCLRINYLI